MSREEEIQRAERNYLVNTPTSDWFSASGKSFRSGVLWADQHPRKGLWDSEKVEKVLGNLLFNKEKKIYRAYLDYDAFFENLRKAMEE